MILRISIQTQCCLDRLTTLRWTYFLPSSGRVQELSNDRPQSFTSSFLLFLWRQPVLHRISHLSQTALSPWEERPKEHTPTQCSIMCEEACLPVNYVASSSQNTSRVYITNSCQLLLPFLKQFGLNFSPAWICRRTHSKGKGTRHL